MILGIGNIHTQPIYASGIPLCPVKIPEIGLKIIIIRQKS
jgi:hypothetical protein